MTYSSTQNGTQGLNWIEIGPSCRTRSMGSNIMVQKPWSRGHSLYVKVRVSMRNASPRHHRTTANGMVSWILWRHLVAYTHEFFHQSCAEKSGFHRTYEYFSTMQDSISDVPESIPNILLCALVSEGDV